MAEGKALLAALLGLLVSWAEAKAPGAPTWNLAGVPYCGYSVSVHLGTPPQSLRLLVDTGSTNLAVAGNSHPLIDRYFVSNESLTNVDLDREVSVSYTQGTWKGRLVRDVVYFPELNSVPNVTGDVSLITRSDAFFMKGADWQGILGLGYPTLARPSSDVESWIDTLRRRNDDKTMAFSLILCGPTEKDYRRHFGAFEIFNNVDRPLYDNLLTATVIREWFYEIVVVGLVADRKPLDIDCKELNTQKAIVDSGTTDIVLPKAVLNKLIDEMLPRWTSVYNKTLKINYLHRKKTTINRTTRDPLPFPVLGDEFWRNQTAVCWQTEQDWNVMPTIGIKLAHSGTQYFTITLPGNSYIRRVVSDGDNEFLFCYKLGLAPGQSTILGVAAMEGFQVIFNRTAGTVGFLKADCGPSVKVTGPFDKTDDGDFIKDCSNSDEYANDSQTAMLNIATYILCVILVIATGLFAYVFGEWLKNKYFKYNVPTVNTSSSLSSLITEDSC